MAKASDMALFEEAGAAAAAPDLLEKIRNKAEEFQSLIHEVESAEEFLKARKSLLNHLKTVELPDLMAQAMLSKFSLEDGFEISIQSFSNGSIRNAKDGQQAGLDYLRSIGGEDLIRSTLSVEFGKTEHNLAKSMQAELDQILRNEGIEDRSAALEDTVHPQTLCGFVNEKLKNGEPIDPERLGVHVGRVAKTKAKKKK